jgi:hypothetical protein
MIAQFSYLDEAQGAGEQHTEPYMQYGEGAAEAATRRFTKSDGGFLAMPKSLPARWEDCDEV